MDFLILPIGWKNWLLLISALVNLIMAIFILNRGIKNKVNLYFALLTFSCFLWSFSIFLQIVLQSIPWSKFWFQTSFIGALGIAVFLMYFVVYFPFKNINLKIWSSYFIFITSFILGILSYTKWNMISFDKIVYKQTYQFIIEYNSIFQWVYSLFFVVLVLCALRILWGKYQQVENFLKKDILILFWMLFIGLGLGSYFNLFLDYMGNFQYEWFGPVFTVPMNLVVIYLIFSKRDKQIEY